MAIYRTALASSAQGLQNGNLQLLRVRVRWLHYPHLTVRQNIGFGLSLARTPKDEMNREIEEVANTLQLSDYLDRKPKALSGGQRQRVAIGRAIARDPEVFLFDEPLSNLDASLRSQMPIELTELHARLGATMIYVTHDQVEAMTMADKIVVLNAGRIEQVGSPMELYNCPATPVVAGFIGNPKMNLLEGKFAKDLGADQAYGIRPEHVSISEDNGKWAGHIKHVERLGADTILHIETDNIGMLLARVGGERSFVSGQSVYASPNPEREIRF